jgi:hypothetical protein
MSDVYTQPWEKLPQGPKPEGRPEYTPITAEVRDYFAHGQFSDVTEREAVAAFNRWLAEHDAAVERAAVVKALRPVADLLAPIIARIDGDRVGTHSVNCHEYHVQCLAVAVQRRIESGESA